MKGQDAYKKAYQLIRQEVFKDTKGGSNEQKAEPPKDLEKGLQIPKGKRRN